MDSIKLGIVTPVLHMNPRFTPPEWEETGALQDVIDVVKRSDELGVDWISCSDHIGIPEDASGIRGGRYWDPFTTLGALSQHTTSVGLLTHMLVLPYHHPLEVVKRLGTLDLLSNGRVILGVGVGSLTREFALLGRTFPTRGARSDDALRAIRASWAQRVPTYEGTHYSFSGMIVEPSGLERKLDIWVGGRTVRSLRRAIELGDGWMPFRLTIDDLAPILKRPDIKDLLDERSSSLELLFAPEPLIDPIGQPNETEQFLASYKAIGATGLSLRFHHTSKAHYLEQLEAVCAMRRDNTW